MDEAMWRNKTLLVLTPEMKALIEAALAGAPAPQDAAARADLKRQLSGDLNVHERLCAQDLLIAEWSA